MARRATKRAIQTEEHLDATPERLQKGEESDLVNPADIDPSEQDRALVRRFRATTTLDILHNNGKFDYREWYAGDWYRRKHAEAIKTPRVVSSYEERTSAGEPNFGLSTNERQCHARDVWREARLQWPENMRGYMDRLLIYDKMPKYGGNQYYASIERVRKCLALLATWLKVPGA